MSAQENYDLIIKARYVLPMDGNFSVIKDGAVCVQENVIAAIGNSEDICKGAHAQEIIDAGNAVILPGLVNAHAHSAMSYFRGIADDQPLDSWLKEQIWPLEAKFIAPEFVRQSSELACLEMAKSGITAFADMYFFENVLAEVSERAGMRILIGEAILDFKTPSAKTPDEAIARTLEYKAAYSENELVRVSFAPHSIYACSKDLLKVVKELSSAHNLPVQFHLAETQEEERDAIAKFNMPPVKYLDSLGILSKRALAAHCIWLDEECLDILVNRGVKIVHNPISNLKLGSGIAPIPDFLEKGAEVSLGTDGAASNNTLDLWIEMRTAALVHKGIRHDPAAVTARETVKMATLGGAQALGLDALTGTLEEGRRADFIVVNLDKPHLAPLFDIYSHLAYSACAADVQDVIINGKIVVRKGEAQTLDEEKIMSEARSWKEKNFN
jgi:5-methylthioadenosine/S-adenosylhomocysteine deaminase